MRVSPSLPASSSRTDSAARLIRYGQWKDQIAEITSYGELSANPLEVIFEWLVDDGNVVRHTFATRKHASFQVVVGIDWLINQIHACVTEPITTQGVAQLGLRRRWYRRGTPRDAGQDGRHRDEQGLLWGCSLGRGDLVELRGHGWQGQPRWYVGSTLGTRSNLHHSCSTWLIIVVIITIHVGACV